MAARVGTVHRRIEEWAWADVWRSGRDFFTFIAVVLVCSILVVTLATAGVARRSGNAVEHARDQQRVATSLAEFRRQLSTADSNAAIIIAAGDQEFPLRQKSYEDAVLQANRWLTEAGLVATGESVQDIEELAGGLVRYGGLVQTAREYPANSTFASLASAKRDCLAHNYDEHPDCRQEDNTPLPTADSVRLTAESALSSTAAGGADGLGIIAVAGLVLGGIVLLGGVLLVAGRTRRWLHWSFLLSALLLLIEFALAAPGLWSQHGEFAAIAGTYGDAYAAANKANLDLLNLRTTELQAVAADEVVGPDGQPALLAEFKQQAQDLRDYLAERDPVSNGESVASPNPLSTAIRDYENAVTDALTKGEGSVIHSSPEESAEDAEGEATEDEERAHRLDAASLTGGSASSYRFAHEIANSTAVRATTDLTERLDATARANVNPWAPLISGVAAACLAGFGVLHRGGAYRRNP